MNNSVVASVIVLCSCWSRWLQLAGSDRRCDCFGGRQSVIGRRPGAKNVELVGYVEHCS